MSSTFFFKLSFVIDRSAFPAEFIDEALTASDCVWGEGLQGGHSGKLSHEGEANVLWHPHEQSYTWGLGWSSVVEHLPSMCRLCVLLSGEG